MSFQMGPQSTRASAVAAKYLARPDAEVLAIVGCGVQGRSHLEAMVTQFPGIRRILASDRTPAHLDRYVQEMRAALGAPLGPASDVESAVRGADIIVTAAERHRRSRAIWARWWRGKSRDGRDPSRGPWPCTWVSRSGTW